MSKTNLRKGRNLIEGTAGDDILNGTPNDDQIVGYAGNDVMFGDKGNDVLIAGLGNDTMTGGAGADQFVFDVAFKPGLRTIDFNDVSVVKEPTSTTVTNANQWKEWQEYKLTVDAWRASMVEQYGPDERAAFTHTITYKGQTLYIDDQFSFKTNGNETADYIGDKVITDFSRAEGDKIVMNLTNWGNGNKYADYITFATDHVGGTGTPDTVISIWDGQGANKVVIGTITVYDQNVSMSDLQIIA